MSRWFLWRRVAAFERAWNYDASYLRDLIDVDPSAMLAFGTMQSLADPSVRNPEKLRHVRF